MKSIKSDNTAVDIYQWGKWSVDRFDDLDKWSSDHFYKNGRLDETKVCIRGGYYE